MKELDNLEQATKELFEYFDYNGIDYPICDYTDQNWGKASNYTLCLNSSQLGYDKCESIIIECV